MSKFSDLNLNPILLTAVEKMGYDTATEVQTKVIPMAMGGQDVMVSSQTGSGKTAAFLLPILHQIMAEKDLPASDTNEEEKGQKKGRGRGRNQRYSMPEPQAIVMCPTRELALQVAGEAIQLKGSHRNFRVATVVGGMPYGRQIRELQNVTLLVATPGRLIDLYKQREISFDKVSFFIADEADRMLDMGFSEDLETLHKSCINNRQTLMFSATFPPKVMHLAEGMMHHPIRVEISPKDTINKNITQILHWADGREHQKKMLLHWLENAEIDQAVVFVPTQLDTEEIAEELRDKGLSVDYLHGGMQQRVRNRCLDNLRRGKTKILVATDVAARGIDVETITHVFNFGVPRQPEDYVHRIGRTGRAGREGIAVTFVHFKDKRLLDAVENFIQLEIKASIIDGLEPKREPVRSAPKGRGRGRGNGGRPGSQARGRGRSDGRRSSGRNEREAGAGRRDDRREGDRKEGGRSERAGTERREDRGQQERQARPARREQRPAANRSEGRPSRRASR
ncbi:DEAD/DEAH box helicase [Ignatzschineria rhizosphaerae]|uniref:DEAD/DEAH box helicase n=1 Tax=Ignatzschineria rhizosphaerae TaxID=2923279 RepID=A0ABY3X5Q0_9GAMM|nr:DEAD/DEAH box helicase [Ignatzschineria rhizosphaerae]UNM97086.1 DEAD/DEAH box helicase [Ignatzschineria rhizosphaerae]